MNREHLNGTTVDRTTPAKQTLQASELSYRRLFEAARDGILILDFDTGRVTDVNPFLTELLGFSHGEMVGHTVGELSPFKDLVSNQAMLERLQDHGYVRYEDLPLEAKDGRKVSVEFVSNVYHAGDQKVIQCNIRDITKRKQTEEQLRWKTALLEAQLEASIDGILVVDNQGNKLLQNRRLTELWKLPPRAAALGNDSERIVYAMSQARNPQAYMGKVAYLYDHPEESSHDELELLDGTTLDRYSAPVRDPAGTYYGRIWSYRDITERRKLEAQFLQSQKMESIGQLAGGIAHDFNNILAAITGSIYLMNLEAADNPALQEHLANLATATRRATDLVNQILTFSRQNKAAREPVKLNHIVLEALKLLRASLPASIRIQTELAETPTVLANPTAIHQVLMNLCTNSWHAMRHQPGVLKVEMSVVEVDADFAKTHPDLHPGPHVRLSVCDTGCGMDRATVKRIFDPFFTTKGVGEGTGLGLAVVHGIMKTHDGGISLYSQPGEGTTFHLYFPVLATEAVPQEIKASPIPRGRGERILFVDDEEFLAALGKNMLERLDYSVTMMTSPLEALVAVREQPERFDLVITDLTMPIMDGLNLGRQLLEIQPHLAIILTTGYSGILTTEKVRELGFQDLLTKPGSARTLGEAVHRALQRKPLTKPCLV